MRRTHAGELRDETTIVDGFDQLPHALLGLFSGQNTGKMIVRQEVAAAPSSAAAKL